MARPADDDFINTYPATARSMIDWVDANIATFITTVPRPAAAKAGRQHLDLTTGVVSLDTGSAWVEIARAAAIAEVPLGTQLSYSAPTLPTDGRWAWADGGLLPVASYGAYFALVGHAYNGGVDPGGGQFRKPDKRGRVSVGADTMPGGIAGGRLPNSNRAFGQNGGEERHPLVTTELPSHSHPADGSGSTLAVAAHSHTYAGASGRVPTNTIGFTRVNVQHGSGAFNNNFVAYSGAGTDSSDGATDNNTAGTDVTGVTGTAGSGTGHNILQPYEVDNVIVRVK